MILRTSIRFAWLLVVVLGICSCRGLSEDRKHVVTWYLMEPDPDLPSYLRGPIKVFLSRVRCERLTGQPPHSGCFPSDDPGLIPYAKLHERLMTHNWPLGTSPPLW